MYTEYAQHSVVDGIVAVTYNLGDDDFDSYHVAGALAENPFLHNEQDGYLPDGTPCKTMDCLTFVNIFGDRDDVLEAAGL